jgi:hypothetical protein
MRCGALKMTNTTSLFQVSVFGKCAQATDNDDVMKKTKLERDRN